MNQTELAWRTPPENLVLTSHEVHVWRADLDPPAPRLKTLRDTLSSDELERADRFHFQRDRDHFIAARGLLRVILGRYLGRGPDELTFYYGPNGKPYLAHTTNGNGLSFNLSRRDGLALYAITRGREVGIDLELIRADLEPEKIAEQFFSPRELVVLQAAPTDMRQEAFFALWTCKEAYVKATGTGLTFPLNQFSVLSATNGSEVLLSIEKDLEEAARWSLRELSTAPGYSAALAVAGHGRRLKYLQVY